MAAILRLVNQKSIMYFTGLQSSAGVVVVRMSLQIEISAEGAMPRDGDSEEVNTNETTVDGRF